MWRKLLIVCLFGALSFQLAGAGTPPERSRDIGSNQVTPAGRHIALVVGNVAYKSDALRNPVNDARAMSAALRAHGFDVMHVENESALGMKEALRVFNRRLEGGGVGLFYFAGHGIQVANRTMLIPVDADSRAPASLLQKGVDLQLVHESMASPRPGKLNLIILDTCLNNPYSPATTGSNSSAASASMPPPPAQTLVAYATTPGTVAADSSGQQPHGMYTAKLLQALSAPGHYGEGLFRHVASSVRATSGGQQVPWITSSLSADFHFPPLQRALHTSTEAAWSLVTGSIDHPSPSRAILPKDSAEQYELAFWDSIKDSNHISDYEAYLQAYPKGRFAALAGARIERLRAAEKTESKAEKPAPAIKPPAERARPAPAPKAQPERVRPAPAAPVAKPDDAPAPSEPAAEGKLPAPTVGISELQDCPTCPTMIALPAGTFTMGSNTGDPSEKPAHRVTINAAFAIGKHEVTVEQWNACAEDGSCPRLANGAERPPKTPVRDVSWDDAQQYVKWLSKASGKAYRLPTEAEWEYAARGGTSTRYWWGEQMRKGTANCKDCGDPWDAGTPANVGSFAANPFGLHDMNGSVWEWVSDCWHTSFKGAPADGKSWDTPNCRERVIRGGSWLDGASYMPSSTRFKYAASVRQPQNGFRVARDLK